LARGENTGLLLRPVFNTIVGAAAIESHHDDHIVRQSAKSAGAGIRTAERQHGIWSGDVIGAKTGDKLTA